MTRTVKISWAASRADKHPLDPPDNWIDAPYRWSGVSGLVVTPVYKGAAFADGEWTLTHRGTGKNLAFKFQSIAAARRTAKRVEGVFDWDDPELIYDFLKPSSVDNRRRCKELLGVEGVPIDEEGP